MGITRGATDKVVHVAICDDSPKDRKVYTEYINGISKKHGIPVTISQYKTGASLLFDICNPKESIDILFMDINLENENGISVTKEIRETIEASFNGEVIFLTHSEEHTIDAFDVRAFHYIVKGKTPDNKFAEIFLAAVEKTGEKNKKHLLLKGIGEYRRLDVNTIHHFEIFNRVVTVFYGNPTQQFEFYSTMQKLEEALLAFKFLRVHRSYLVNVEFVEKVSRQGLTLKDSTTIPVGRSYYDAIKAACENEESV